MDIKENILEAIGNTPLVRLNKVTKEVDATVLAKVEFFFLCEIQKWIGQDQPKGNGKKQAP